MVESSSSQLLQVFKSFSGGQDTMDGRQFAKLTKDTKLQGGGFTTTDVDLIFAKVKDKSARRITFAQFEEALKHIGAKKKKTPEEIAQIIVSAGGPTFTGTQAEAVKWHDNKELYTGVYAKGGPTNVDNVVTLSNLADRTEADVRGVKKGSKK